LWAGGNVPTQLRVLDPQLVEAKDADSVRTILRGIIAAQQRALDALGAWGDSPARRRPRHGRERGAPRVGPAPHESLRHGAGVCVGWSFNS